MNIRKKLNFRIVFVVLVIGVLAPSLIAETLYVNGISGDDNSLGTKDKPLKTINKAAAMVNDSNAPGPTTIKIGPGVYNLTKAVVFENIRSYTKEKRLTIEATILPDDPNWKPALMPVVLSTQEPTRQEKLEDYIKYGTQTCGFQIEINHVTICGLKFLGDPTPNNRHYPIRRNSKTAKDLIVTQCLFVGDKAALPIQVPIIANGHNLIVDHCIFYNCKNSVVFWNAEGGVSKNNAMKYCIVYGAYVSGVWTCQTAEDFEFHNNIITNCECFWMRDRETLQKYRLNDCIVNNSKFYSGYYNEKNNGTDPTGPEIIYEEENIIKKGKITLVKGKSYWPELSVNIPKDYLHVVEGTLGSELGAGLFKKGK
jgi:hypothetical protein